MSTTWTFTEPQATVAITSQRVIRDGAPILFATHAIEDGTWLFLDARLIDAEDEITVELGTLARHDPTILDLARLPLGWHARRRSVAEPWISYPGCGS
ncbi:MAG TPA: hypothetical protein VFZ66_00245 [Herpetosiphonaceae bacterium]